MKVNMALISDDNKKQQEPEVDIRKHNVHEDTEDNPDADAEEDEDDDIDESGSHSKLKTFLLIAAMIGGFGLFVWNMTGLVNNMRLDNQGYAVNVVREMENIDDYESMDDDGESSNADDQVESEVSTDAARDGPGEEDSENPESSAGINNVQHTDESEELTALRNEVELLKQERKIVEDMLDSSLGREEECKAEIERLEARIEELEAMAGRE